MSAFDPKRTCAAGAIGALDGPRSPSPEQVNTFDAYKKLGMKKDYRRYSNISDICHMLGINSEFILLTNNPDKVKGLQKHGIKIKNIEHLEIDPNPFNQPYLISKQQSGHLLCNVKKKTSRYVIPFEPVEVFDPYNLESDPRFIYVSSYYLPIKPVDDKIMIMKEEYDSLSDNAKKDIRMTKLSDDEYIIKIMNEKLYDEYPELLCKPYWFRVYVYYDIVPLI